MKKWKPIDTAPKDGIKILLLPSDGSYCCFVGYYSNNTWRIDTENCDFDIYNNSVISEPSHWMYLPDLIIS